MKGLCLTDAAAKFVHERCEGLRYDEKKTAEEIKNGIYLGKSIKENQIPYNMQMDTDRLCLEVSLKHFLASGTAKDAFDVYFCFIEMFIGEYGKSRTLVELLSEFESNGSSLLMKHRDHYSHSVYVFALGLAIFETNKKYRDIYADFYKLEQGGDSPEAAHHFLRYWGLTSLFHDIGYPLELPFEQAVSYFEVNKENRSERPYLAYHSVKAYSGAANEILAKNISDHLGKTYNFDYDYILDVIIRKPRYPEDFNYFMDHAYFSAIVLFKKLYEEMKYELTEADIDALSSIILHNSMYKFCVAHYKEDGNIPLKAELLPLGYMLMLCDELQCWDRTAYGRNSRAELQPMDCSFEFAESEIKATYIYDESQRYKEKNLKNKAPGKPAFDEDIASIVFTEMVGLASEIEWKPRTQGRKHTYLSSSNFMSLYNFAVALNGRWNLGEDWKQALEEGNANDFLTEKTEEFQTMFEDLSLEYKLSNINQAKTFDEYLNAIGAFYTDKEVDYEELTEFTEAECRKIGPMEHERWLKEHLEMGWKYGDLSGDERERQRRHKDMISEEFLVDGKLLPEAAKLHYIMLDKEEQDKDVQPMNAMLSLLNIYDGVRLYRMK
ncbi:MAG: hypothetical protein MJ086_02770 [Lachnospiraceae bacterium]|nr:hypothetical protein [Lachnospiraceae bacterium]